MTTTHAYLFPGQGAQTRGMGVDLVEAHPEARSVFEAGREVLGFDVYAICRDGPDDELNSTRVSQPAIFLHSMGVLEVLGKHLGVDAAYGTALPASAAAGLSLGEYSALVFAAAMTFEDALFLVGKRGEYMQEACDAEEGSMASVIGLTASQVEEVVADAVGDGNRAGLEVGIANYNSPSQTVISGERRAVEETVEKLKAAGARRAVMLQVAGAYHSPLMASAARKMEPLLEKVTISPPRVPFFGNYSGDQVSDPDQIRRGLTHQIDSAVRWDQSVRAMIENGVVGGGALEIGPGRVIRGLMRNIDSSVSVQSIGDVEALDKLEVLPL